jgi:hypothetical protein
MRDKIFELEKNKWALTGGSTKKGWGSQNNNRIPIHAVFIVDILFK